jgi:para-nitrobenzyl esterase
LDVWAPSRATKGSKLPVKVWIYGGSETEGSISDPLYDGCNTADGGSILVTINYRLGPLGFTALSSAGIHGNQGIQDILLGLQWVQENIAAFGGDPVCQTSNFTLNLDRRANNK